MSEHIKAAIAHLVVGNSSTFKETIVSALQNKAIAAIDDERLLAADRFFNQEDGADEDI